MKIIYMGTPDFAVGPLESMIKAGHEITAVVTQPDRPKGRSGALVASPVKETALKYNIPVLQPEKIRDPEAIERLRAYPADIFVVAAFGQILTKEVLDMPAFGCINIHASLLPHLRGASPIQHAILLGDEVTGVTIMQMDEGLDTGDILLQEEVKILDTDTGGSLFDKLAKLGSELIVKALPMIERGELTPIPQDDAAADKVGMLKKSMGLIDFNRSAIEIDRQVRGLDPWPGAYTSYNGKTLKIWGVKPLGAEETENMTGLSASMVDITRSGRRPRPGMIVHTDKQSMYVYTAEGILRVDELQLEGKKRMRCADFMLGVNIGAGQVLGI